MTRMRFVASAFAGMVAAFAATARAQAPHTHADTAKLGGVTIVAPRDSVPRLSPMQQATLPASAGVTAARAAESVNLVDAEDAVKYLPSVFLRKRNNGDTQAVMGTRVWGVSSSARSLVYADGVPLSALIANNNNIGGPRWGLVAPAEIARVDVMYGPFSAAYPGNSMGAVLEMTTRMPTKREGSISQGYAAQRFDLYGMTATYGTAQTAASLGDRRGRLSYWVSGNYQDSHSQPLSYVTSASFPAGTTGGFADVNKLGATANVLGAAGLQESRMANGKVKLVYEITKSVSVGYTIGVWGNDTRASAQSFLLKNGAPTYGGARGFADGTFEQRQRHSMQSLTIRTASHKDWHWEGVATRYRFDRDEQRLPGSSLSTGLDFSTTGRAAVLTGTGWMTGDVKGMWHRGGLGARHVVSFGAHLDEYRLLNPTYSTAEWRRGAYGRDVPGAGGVVGALATEGDGKTSTSALWTQDAWRLRPTLRLTVGGRLEHWRAFDGVNVAGQVRVSQPAASLTRFSPKAVLAWDATQDLVVTASMAKAYRFATVAELYQLVQTGSTFSSPNPDLRPDNVLASELRIDRRFARGSVQAAAFLDDVHDAMLSQFLPLGSGSTTPVAYVSNVDHVRAGGLELSATERGIGWSKLDLAASVTWLEARILAISGRANATAPVGGAQGKFLPNIPRWRGNVVATYRPSSRATIALAGRYSDMLYTTLDNADVHPNSYGGFAPWFVADAKASYALGHGLRASLGVDNLLNRKYFVFHAFPQRTIIGGVMLDF